MKRISGVSIAVLTSVAFALGALPQGFAAMPQEKAPPPAQKAPATTDKVTVIFLGNASCPLDDKAVDKDRYVEVESQRVYVCSEACASALKKDSAAAEKAIAKAYPVATPVVAKNCFCGKAVDKAQAADANFQGHKVSLCCSGCASEFKKGPVTAIALMMNPASKDAKNATDPIDGKTIDVGVVAIYKGHLVHFATFANAIVFEKDPDPWMTKLKLSS
jgi:YHS domain-containing protein